MAIARPNTAATANTAARAGRGFNSRRHGPMPATGALLLINRTEARTMAIGNRRKPEGFETKRPPAARPAMAIRRPDGFLSAASIATADARKNSAAAVSDVISVPFARIEGLSTQKRRATTPPPRPNRRLAIAQTRAANATASSPQAALPSRTMDQALFPRRWNHASATTHSWEVFQSFKSRGGMRVPAIARGSPATLWGRL